MANISVFVKRDYCRQCDINYMRNSSNRHYSETHGLGWAGPHTIYVMHIYTS